MKLLLKIVSVFIFCIACSAMLFSMFLSSLSDDSQNFLVDFFKDYSPSNEEDFRYVYLSERESYYSQLNWDLFHIVEKDDESLVLTLTENDKILTSFYNPLNNYIITGTWFTVRQKGIWEIYIDMLSRQNRYFIQPLTTPIELSFTSPDGSEYNTIYLFPGQYIVFDPARNSFYANADIARMQILTDIWYISDFWPPPERLLVYIWEETSYHLYLEKLQEKILYYQLKSEELLWLEISNFSSVSLIERYFLIFLNPEKKRTYYQNRIVESYLSLMKIWSMDRRIKLAEISRYLSLLKDINVEAHNESYETLLRFNSLMFRNTQPENIEGNVSLSLIENTPNISQELLLYTFYTFTSSRITQITSEDERLIKNYIKSFSAYYGENKIAMQYFSYLLQEKTLELLASPQNMSYKSILLYLWEYITLSQASFIDSKLEKKSLLYIYQNLIELLELYLRGTFFQAERTQTSLLVQKEDMSFNSEELSSLRRQVLSLLTHYTNNTEILDDTILRDVSLKASIMEKSVLLREYLAALTNYEAYTLEFDKVSRELLDLGRWNDISQMITNEVIITYLSRFQWLWLWNIQIDIDEGGNVRIEWISISWRLLAFTLLPLAWNRIRDISIDGNKLIFEYPLDNIESDWEEKMRTASEEEKDMFDFRRFFLITLIEDRRDLWRDIITDTVISTQEDTVIAVFKREVLLSQNGEFSQLRDIMQFSYNDIIVTRRDDTFDIFLDGVWLILQLRESRNNITYNGFFSSEYILTDDTRSFKDIKLQIYEDLRRSERTVFWPNRLHILWEVPFTEIRDVLADITDNFVNILSIINILNNVWVPWEISMQYSPGDKKLIIRFDFWGERHTIVYNSFLIESYLRWRERVITKPMPVSNLSEYFN